MKETFQLLHDERGQHHLYKRIRDTHPGALTGWEKVAEAHELFELMQLLSNHFTKCNPATKS